MAREPATQHDELIRYIREAWTKVSRNFVVGSIIGYATVLPKALVPAKIRITFKVDWKMSVHLFDWKMSVNLFCC